MIGRRAVLIVATLVSTCATTQGWAVEACPPSSADSPGLMVQIHLCAADARRCKADDAIAYRARRPADRELTALSVPEIPDGWVIVGAELFSSGYDLASRGFKDVRFAAHGAPSDYCGRHGQIDMRADWTGDDVGDQMTIDVCVRYEKWSGPRSAEPCPLAAR